MEISKVSGPGIRGKAERELGLLSLAERNLKGQGLGDGVSSSSLQHSQPGSSQ